MKNKMLALVALCSATSSTMPLWAVEWNDPGTGVCRTRLEN